MGRSAQRESWPDSTAGRTFSAPMPLNMGISGSMFSGGAAGARDHSSSFQAPFEDVTGAIARVMRFSAADRLALLEINCEGCEYTLLAHLLASPALLSLIDLITVQYHGQKPHHSVPRGFRAAKCDIERRLNATHAPIFIWDFVWEGWVSRALLGSAIL